MYALTQDPNLLYFHCAAWQQQGDEEEKYCKTGRLLRDRSVAQLFLDLQVSLPPSLPPTLPSLPPSLPPTCRGHFLPSSSSCWTHCS
jgi:hypothetical protein